MRRSVLGCIQAATLLGLALGTLGAANADSIVANGNFATGDFTSWTLTGNSLQAYVTSPFADGNYAAALTTDPTAAPPTDGQLSQTLATLSGTTYLLSFDLTSDGATPDTLTTSLGGTVLSAPFQK